MQRMTCFALVLLLLAGSPCPATAAGAQPGAGPIREIDRLGGASMAVAVAGQYAFVGQSAEFALLAMDDGSQPQRIAYLPLAANDIALHNSLAFVTNKEGVVAIDVAAPTAPRQLGMLALPEAVGALAVDGEYAYAVAPRGRLYVVSIADPTHLRLAGVIHLPPLEGIAVEGGYAYLATGAGLQILSVADPEHPEPVSALATLGAAEAVAVVGGYAYVTATAGGLTVIDVADPHHPVQVSALALPTYTRNLQVVGDRAYVANGNRGVAVVDVGDPQRPHLLGVNTAGTLTTDLAVAGDLVYVTDIYEGGLRVLAGAASGQAVEVGAWRTPGITFDVAAAGAIAYVAMGLEGDIAIVDGAAAGGLAVAGDYRTPGRTTAVRVDGDRLLAYGVQGAMVLLDIAEPLRPVAMTVHDLAAGDSVVAVQQGLGFVSDGEGIVHILAASPAGDLQEIGRFGAEGTVSDVAVTPAHLLAAAGEAGVLVARMAGGMGGATAQAVAVPGLALHVAAEGSHGYVVTNAGRLHVLDLETAGDSAIMGEVALGVPVRALHVAKGYAYLAAGEAGVYVVDVADPRRPVLVGVYDTPGAAANVAVVGDRLYVADGQGGLLLLEVVRNRDPRA